MALKAIVDAEAFEALSEDFQAEYKKQADGSYLLDVSEAGGLKLENVSGLRSALESERENFRNAKKLADSFGDMSPAEVKALVKKAKQLEGNVSETEKFKQALSEREAQIVAKHEKELNAERDKNGMFESQLEKHLIESKAVAAINEHGGNVKLLLLHVRSSMKMVRNDDGDFVAQVVNESGVPRITEKSGSQDAMGISELVASMKTTDDFSRAFAGSGNKGTGSHSDDNDSNSNQSGPKTRISRSDQEAINANFEAIASGDVIVVD